MEASSQTTTVLLVGVGGQGTILAGDLLAKTAAASGYDVKLSEIHGMSQRGGSVSTVVRFGEKVSSMICDPGCANFIVSFEIIEALRAKPFLSADNGKLFVNDEVILPVSVATGVSSAPQDLDERLEAMNAIRIDAMRIAREVNSPKSANVVLMGALSTALPFAQETWHEVISKRVPPKTIEANLKAFAAGRSAIRG